MKAWNKPEIAAIDINETAGGVWDVDFEGPLNLLFGDKRDSTPDAAEQKKS